MKTLWIYGDSFAVDWKQDWGWQRQLANNLTVDRVVNQASAGCSNEWTMLKFLEDDHQPKDIVIMFFQKELCSWRIARLLCLVSKVAVTKQLYLLSK